MEFVVQLIYFIDGDGRKKKLANAWHLSSDELYSASMNTQPANIIGVGRPSYCGSVREQANALKRLRVHECICKTCFLVFSVRPCIFLSALKCIALVQRAGRLGIYGLLRIYHHLRFEEIQKTFVNTCIYDIQTAAALTLPTRSHGVEQARRQRQQSARIHRKQIATKLQFANKKAETTTTAAVCE
ncbi:Hypothetical_protein [Hexamita inflata]|uniref:Hypothetical_protein n=1 Tax=Hexamita inflata TaxID=28002 RepID=A0AA86TT30_9EUKA|nr:Hypothetical protein HINF_LOCUS8943 [Hexamita inflata]